MDVVMEFLLVNNSKLITKKYPAGWYYIIIGGAKWSGPFPTRKEAYEAARENVENLRISDSKSGPTIEAEISVELPLEFANLLILAEASVSAYETYVGNSERRGVRDAFFKTRQKDFQAQLVHARQVWRRLFK